MVGQPSFVGLDLGSHALKVAELVRSNGSVRVTRIGMVQTPPGAVTKGVAADRDALVPAIRHLLQETGIRSKRVATALGGQAVTIRELRVPDMPEAELEQAVTFEAERYVPPGITEVSCHYDVLGRNPEDGQLEILLVATGKELIDRQVAPLSMAGLMSEMMEVTPFSMVRGVSPHNGQSDSTTVYMDLGAESSDILILNKERSRLARNIPLAGNALTHAIAEAMNVNFATAQALKEQRATMLVEGEQADDMTLRRLHQAILPVVTRICAELRRSLDFYVTRVRGQAISKIILTGGTAKLNGLAPFLREQLGLPVEIGNPFRTCETTYPPEFLADVAPMMAVAVGLALEGG